VRRDWNDAGCPAEVLEAIPWYPDGLTSIQRGAIEAHAAVCAECRRELAAVQGEPAGELAAAPEAERVWERVLERIAADDDGDQLPAAGPGRAPRRTAGWQRAAARPLSLAASLALALGLGALGTAIGLGLAGGGDEPVYRTATAPLPEVSAAGPTLDVVFRKDASAGEIERTLRGIGGSVVAGPSSLGVYRVALRPGVDAAGAAAALRAEAGGVASLAEPVHP
jgi:hypothetical protein